jgi:hypothetical protein
MRISEPTQNLRIEERVSPEIFIVPLRSDWAGEL